MLAILSDDIKTAFNKTKDGQLTARDAFNLDGLKTHLERFAQDNKLHRFELQSRRPVQARTSEGEMAAFSYQQEVEQFKALDAIQGEADAILSTEPAFQPSHHEDLASFTKSESQGSPFVEATLILQDGDYFGAPVELK